MTKRGDFLACLSGLMLCEATLRNIMQHHSQTPKDDLMAQSVRLDDGLVNEVKVAAEAAFRSIPRQIEYWVRIGRMVEDNPELSYNMILDILRAEAEVKHGMVTSYRRLTPREDKVMCLPLGNPDKEEGKDER